MRNKPRNRKYSSDRFALIKHSILCSITTDSNYVARSKNDIPIGLFYSTTRYFDRYWLLEMRPSTRKRPCDEWINSTTRYFDRYRLLEMCPSTRKWLYDEWINSTTRYFDRYRLLETKSDSRQCLFERDYSSSSRNFDRFRVVETVLRSREWLRDGSLFSRPRYPMVFEGLELRTERDKNLYI